MLAYCSILEEELEDGTGRGAESCVAVQNSLRECALPAAPLMYLTIVSDSIQAAVTLPAFAAHNNDTSLPDICGFNGDHVEDTESHIIGMKGVQDTLDWRKRRQLEESIFI